MSASVTMRPPGQVMRLERMGAFHQSRLSFMRILLRRMQAEAWRFERPQFDIDAAGVGTAQYSVVTPKRTYTLVVFAHDLPDGQRSDRVIATAWDATFALHDGVPTTADVERLRANVPLQEVGRLTESELTLSRANRSVRLWSHVVDALAEGRQPDRALLDSVGYLMRTTAVYGSGKFGAADRTVIADRPEFTPPFQVEMLTVYLIRAFVLDLVEHLAAQRSPGAVTLAPRTRRSLGVGNSTGLGMAPFLLAHPRLVNNWIEARERALAAVRSIEQPTPEAVDQFLDYLFRSRRSVELWRTDHPLQSARIQELLTDIDRLVEYLRSEPVRPPFGWDRVYRWSELNLGLEGQEMVTSLLLEPHGDLIDHLAATMHADEDSLQHIDGSTSLADVKSALDEHYGWALGIDWTPANAEARAWYVSADKLEPRLGERHDEPVGAYEQPLQPGRDAARMARALTLWPADAKLGDFLRALPEHRHVARRLRTVADAPYAEIRDNTIDGSMMPVDLLRAKLSFFGATHFDPRSDRWVRINMFRGAPFPHELSAMDADDWIYPDLVEVTSG